MKKMIAVFLCLIISIGAFATNTYAAPDWPSDVSIEAEGGIVMGVDAGTVPYSKNIHIPYFPASITKIPTALIIIENCDLNETVASSHNAVYNVESSDSGIGLDAGDTLSVWDYLHVVLLKSANEVTSALAEHMAGTIEDFAVLMNRKVASLGCRDSSFASPSGLGNPGYYTSVYDIALIGQAASKNETFVDIGSALYYDLPVTRRDPGGARIYPGHRMIKKNPAEYYSGAFGGETGYTSLAGNTLIALVKHDGMTLASVILDGHQTHYNGTRKLLDFGFQNFQSVVASDYNNIYTSIENNMTIAGLSASNLFGLMLDEISRVTSPKNTDFSSVTSSITYDLSDTDPVDTIAEIQYQLGDRAVGATCLEFKTSGISGPAMPAITLADIADTTLESTTVPEPEPVKKGPIRIPPTVWAVLAVVVALTLLITTIIMMKGYLERKEASGRNRRRERRLQRLQEIGYSSVESDLLVEQRRSSYTLEPLKRHWNIKFPFKKKQFSVQYKENETISKKDLQHNIIVISAYLFVVTTTIALFSVTTENTINVAIVYVLAAILIARQTEGYMLGIIASYVSAVFISFISTYPFIELNLTLDGYPLIFIALIFITVMTSTLTTHLKEQTRIPNEREHLLTEAEKERMQANLLRTISRDLHAPLISIIGTTDNYLEHGSAITEGEKTHLIHNISEDASWLLNMVENLLSVTGIQGKGASAVTTLEPLEEAIPDAVIRFHRHFPDAAVQMSIPGDFITAPMGVTLIEQVIISLLKNAVYHSSSDVPIGLIITMDEHFARPSIKDHGKGIDEAIIPALFDDGTPASGQCSDSHKGTGVGLSVCKTITNARHSDLSARSHEDRTELILMLPIGKGHYEP